MAIEKVGDPYTYRWIKPNADGSINVSNTGVITDGYRTYEAATSASPGSTIIDVNNDLGRNGHIGYFACDGAGSLLVSFDEGAGTYGSSATLRSGDVMDLEGIDVDRVQIVYAGAVSNYRVFVK